MFGKVKDGYKINWLGFDDSNSPLYNKINN